VVANFDITPASVSLIGFIAGVLSIVGYSFVQPWLERKIGLFDTCGIHNLHGMPSVLGAIASVILVESKAEATTQLLAALVTLCVALPSGAFTGFLMTQFAPEECDHVYFTDDVWFEVEES